MRRAGDLKGLVKGGGDWVGGRLGGLWVWKE